MTRNDHRADGPSDIDWLLLEMEREGLRRSQVERLLQLLAQITDGRGLRRCEVRAALRRHVAGSMLQITDATDARRRLPALLQVSKRTAERAVAAALSTIPRSAPNGRQ